MTQDPKPIPKSLHTVTALVAVGALLVGEGWPEDEAVNRALDALGYAGAPDPHGLRERARAALTKHLDADYARDTND